MKKQIIILKVCLLYAMTIPVCAQNIMANTSDSTRLNKVAIQLQSGVFVRTIPQYNPTPEKNDTTKKNGGTSIPNYLTNTYYFFRFDSIWPLLPNKQVYLAKMFISERVFENVFSKKYITDGDYMREEAGMYVMAKVFMENKNSEPNSLPRIKVFPTYTTNLVSKKMYKCARKTKDYKTHLQKLVWEVQEKNQDSVFFREIKCFDIEMRNEQIENLRLAFTKYARSDDEITNSSYFLRYTPYKKATETNAIIALSLKEDSRIVVDKVVTKNSVMTTSNSSKPLIITDPVSATKRDTLVSIQATKPTEAWLYAGMFNKDSTWATKYVKWDNKYPIKQGDKVSALYRLQLRAGNPYKENNAWRKEKVIYICDSGQQMEVLDRQYIPYYKDNSVLIWLKVKLL